MELAERLADTRARNSEWEAHRASLKREHQNLKTRLDETVRRGKLCVSSLESSIRYTQRSMDGVSKKDKVVNNGGPGLIMEL
jgi:hypothetical protein